MRLSIVPTLAAASIALAACGNGDSSADAGLSASCLEAENHSDIEWIQDEIFTPSCASFTACHKGRALSAEGLNLEAGNSEMNMVGVPHHEFTDEILVVPGSPETSYLMVLIGDRPGTLNAKGTMPLNNPLLCKPKRDAIARWITNLSPQPDAGPPDAGVADASAPDAN